MLLRVCMARLINALRIASTRFSGVVAIASAAAAPLFNDSRTIVAKPHAKNLMSGVTGVLKMGDSELEYFSCAAFVGGRGEGMSVSAVMNDRLPNYVHYER